MIIDITIYLATKVCHIEIIKNVFTKTKIFLLDLKDSTLIYMSVVGGGQTGTFGNKFSVPITGMSTSLNLT